MAFWSSAKAGSHHLSGECPGTQLEDKGAGGLDVQGVESTCGLGARWGNGGGMGWGGGIHELSVPCALLAGFRIEPAMQPVGFLSFLLFVCLFWIPVF